MKPSLPDLAVRAAPLTFVFLWSTGFISAKYGMPYAEPLTFLFARMGLVVLVLAAIVTVMRVPLPGPLDAWHSLVAGFLVQTLYLGGVFVALSTGVPAGISALIPGLQPILTATLASRFLGERVTSPVMHRIQRLPQRPGGRPARNTGVPPPFVAAFSLRGSVSLREELLYKGCFDRKAPETLSGYRHC